MTPGRFTLSDTVRLPFVQDDAPSVRRRPACGRVERPPPGRHAGSRPKLRDRPPPTAFNDGHGTQTSTRPVSVIRGLSGTMPTILRGGPYRVFFYSGDGHEPPHVHVERDDAVAKFWLNPVRLVSGEPFSRRKSERIRRLVESRRAAFVETWHEYFSG